jgi:hypothetical protein
MRDRAIPMFRLIKENQSAILAGLIATALFLYFVGQALNVLVWVVLSVAGLISPAYVDTFYVRAARLAPQNYAFVWIAIVFVLLAAVFFVVGVLRLLPKRWVSAVLAKNKKNREKTASEAECIFCKLISGFLALIIAGVITVVLVGNYAQLQLTAGFQQHMRILAPYISAQQERELISQWSLMSGQKDYDRLYEALNKIAREHQIVLPTPGK